MSENRPDPHYSVRDWWTRRWEKIDPESGQRRFYTVDLRQDLWGQWILTKAWGRIGQRPSRVVKEVVFDANHADSVLSDVAKTRLKHGYREC
ncbi:WGR domain-containing protein [Acidithiobacillus thiooxidans]|uniref:WGR domain-containing protein n=1 Tax=Acidithiobacillus thiooxidans TaxID=930 RepID=UPI001C0703BD|nr:WGR domain-containing protein [Acidithiobacillus thiooxidans]MBU2834415.1 WGR domain-containing protein [Acidithiobacillus thiooxidans]